VKLFLQKIEHCKEGVPLLDIPTGTAQNSPAIEENTADATTEVGMATQY
jgi:hypothetical protein